MILTKDNIDNMIMNSCSKLSELGVEKIGVFGSASREEMHEDSDLDFLVIFRDGQKNYDNYIEVAYLLEEIFSKKIDLLTPEALSENLKSYILPEVKFIEIRP